LQVFEEPFDAESIHAGLRTAWLGSELHYYPLIGSTNDEAKRLAGQGASDGTLLIADAQSAGRGRLKRRWVAPAGSALLLSLILRPPLEPAQAPRLTMICGLAAADALEQVAGVRAGLKWPNDLLIGDRKMAGILTEMATLGETLDFVVVGIGINVNARPARLADDADADAQRQDPSLATLATEATSLAEEAGRPISRLELLWRFMELLEGRYRGVLSGESPFEEWSARLSILGRRIAVDLGREKIEGRAAGVDADGALIVELDDGTRRPVLAGDVALVRR
jgi:BirA family transcriptional regulator, biotin operon repressor / biotin---[acetyl-CoA-carboxylase] ligase